MSEHRIAGGAGRVPIRPGLFEVPKGPGAEPYLIGTRCLDCGRSFFPRRARCAVCFSRSVVDGPLSRRGRIESATAVRQAPVEYRGDVPYALGLVRLPEGVLVHAPLTGKDPGGWQLAPRLFFGRGDPRVRGARPLQGRRGWPPDLRRCYRARWAAAGQHRRRAPRQGPPARRHRPRDDRRDREPAPRRGEPSPGSRRAGRPHVQHRDVVGLRACPALRLIGGRGRSSSVPAGARLQI